MHRTDCRPPYLVTARRVRECSFNLGERRKRDRGYFVHCEDREHPDILVIPVVRCPSICCSFHIHFQFPISHLDACNLISAITKTPSVGPRQTVLALPSRANHPWDGRTFFFSSADVSTASTEWRENCASPHALPERFVRRRHGMLSRAVSGGIDRYCRPGRGGRRVADELPNGGYERGRECGVWAPLDRLGKVKGTRSRSNVANGFLPQLAGCS